MKSLISETLINLANQEPEQHAETRQLLYEQLDLSFEKQLALYSCVLGPASSGKLENSRDFAKAIDSAIRIIEMPEH
ncbi:PAS factor family protein [Vibrio cholerae]|uniref:PAS factor family protein n=1 Tax=Vibrio cholerae TaxID=666 RepID=UPI001A2616DA|nr:secretion protein [Vibrio cholerae]HAS5579555.1 secretion protein [Vibrio cholerae]